MANGNYYPDISVEITPRLNSDEAETIALSEVGVTGELLTDIQSELMVYPEEGRFYLAWQVLIALRDAEWQALVDAHTGLVLRCDDILITPGEWNRHCISD